MCNWTLEVRDILKILWKREEQFLLFSTIFFFFFFFFLHIVRFSFLGRGQIFTSRYAVIRDKRGRDSESQLYATCAYSDHPVHPQRIIRSPFMHSIVANDYVSVQDAQAGLGSRCPHIFAWRDPNYPRF